MANLTSYNTLAEAIAFNLTDENLEELGYTNFNGLTKGIISNKFKENAIIPPKGVVYRKGLYEETNSFKNIDYKQMEFDSIENILQTGKYLNSITTLKDKTTREIDTTNPSYMWKSSTGIDAGVVNKTYTGFFCDIQNNITKMPFFGNFDEPNYRACLYDSFKTEYKTLVGLRNRLASDGIFYYSPLTDFRYFENKKVIKVSELIDGSFLGMINLIPNNTVGFVYKDTNYNGVVDTNNQYDQFCTDILNGKDIVSSYEKVQAFENKYSGKYTIFYRTANVLYFGNLDDVSITAMFTADNGLDYPLNKSGYIDYSNIDYSKTYTSALGAAKVSPKIINKMLGWSWMNVDAFTNDPKDDTQGVATKISITNQVLRPSDNTATITITLGYTKINGTKYNDELQELYSANQYINIVKVNNTTYTVSFRNTTNPQTDFVYIPIKNTYTNVVTDNFYELELVKDNVTEVVRLRQSKYEVTISNCKTISGYVYYERKTSLTTDEKNNLKQADVQKAFEFFNTNIVSFPRLTPFDPIEIKSITFGDRNVMCIFKGKTLSKNEQYRVGTYHYDIKTIGSNIESSLDVILCADASDGTQDPGTGNSTNNPNKKPSGGTVSPGSGGNGSGGTIGGGSGNRGSGSGSMLDDDTNTFEKDLNADPKRESLTTPSGDSCIIPKTDNEYVDLSELFEFADSEVTVTSDPIFTDETLIGLGGQGDGSVILSRNYSGGTVWTYPTTDDTGNRHLGTIFTNEPALIPKIRTYVTVKAKYKKANAKGEGTDSSGNRVLATFVFWQYAQSFTLVNSATNPTESTEIIGGDTSTYHPTVTDIFKLTWNNYNDYNPTLTEDDVILNYNGDPSNISIKVKWKWNGVGLTPNEGKIAIKDILNICAYTEGLEADQLRELYNIPEASNFTLTNAPTGSTLDADNFNVTFTSNGYLSFTLDYGNTKPDLYGQFDIKTTMTDVNGLSYAIEGKNYDIKYAYKTRDVYVNINNIKTAEPTFDLTQIKKVNLEVTETRDFMGKVIPPKGA